MTHIRTDWTREEIAALFDLPFTELLFQAKTVGTDRAILLDLDSVDRIPLLLLLELIDTTDRLGVTSIDQLITRPPARDAAGAGHAGGWIITSGCASSMSFRHILMFRGTWPSLRLLPDTCP